MKHGGAHTRSSPKIDESPLTAPIGRPPKKKTPLWPLRVGEGTQLESPRAKAPHIGYARSRQRDPIRSRHLGEGEEDKWASLVRHSARLELLATLAWAEVVRHGCLEEAPGAFAAFLTAGRELREVLKLLGLERRAKPVPDLKTYLRTLAEKKAAEAGGGDAAPAAA